MLCARIAATLLRKRRDVICEVCGTRLLYVVPSCKTYPCQKLQKKKILYSFCLMVEASDHGYVLHTRRIHVTRYNVVRVGYIYFFSNE
jgi:hypothetical protein